MTPRAKRRQRGQAVVEFTLIAIPMIFILISTTEMARGMWNYQTLAVGVRAGARFAAAHGQGCSQNGNSCAVTVSDVAHSIATGSVGMVPADMNVVLSSATAASVTCSPLSNCYGNGAMWPPAADNAPGKNITIQGTWTFKSALAMYWPGHGAVKFGTFTFGAWTKQPILF